MWERVAMENEGEGGYDKCGRGWLLQMRERVAMTNEREGGYDK